jgi:hypothetical protein
MRRWPRTQRALEIEPLSITANIVYSHCLFYTGRIDESEAQMRKTIELAPEFGFRITIFPMFIALR